MLRSWLLVSCGVWDLKTRAPAVHCHSLLIDRGVDGGLDVKGNFAARQLSHLVRLCRLRRAGGGGRSATAAAGCAGPCVIELRTMRLFAGRLRPSSCFGIDIRKRLSIRATMTRRSRTIIGGASALIRVTSLTAFPSVSPVGVIAFERAGSATPLHSRIT